MRDRADRTLARLERPLLYVMSAFYVVAGAMHFVIPGVYAQIVPPGLPQPLALVYLSGAAEILLGIGVLFPRTRRLAAWGIVVLLVAVFPANVYMATHDVVLEGVPAWANSPSDAATWARLPFQLVFVGWAWWYTRPIDDTD
jgi:uncharacterized membrane protein